MVLLVTTAMQSLQEAARFTTAFQGAETQEISENNRARGGIGTGLLPGGLAMDLWHRSASRQRAASGQRYYNATLWAWMCGLGGG